MSVTIAKSAWGWTAYGDRGQELAHSKNKLLLEDYIRDCDGLELEDLL
jgi:hypothetical protein